LVWIEEKAQHQVISIELPDELMPDEESEA